MAFVSSGGPSFLPCGLGVLALAAWPARAQAPSVHLLVRPLVRLSVHLAANPFLAYDLSVILIRDEKNASLSVSCTGRDSPLSAPSLFLAPPAPSSRLLPVLAAVPFDLISALLAHGASEALVADMDRESLCYREDHFLSLCSNRVASMPLERWVYASPNYAQDLSSPVLLQESCPVSVIFPGLALWNVGPFATV